MQILMIPILFDLLNGPYWSSLLSSLVSDISVGKEHHGNVKLHRRGKV